MRWGIFRRTLGPGGGIHRYELWGIRMSLYSEFKTFAMRGNAIDLAVGVVIGAAFTSIVNSLVKDIINPPLGLLIGGIDFSNLFVVLRGTGTRSEERRVGKECRSR